MEYETEFTGELLFKNPLSEREISFIENFFGDELFVGNAGIIYANLEFNKDFTGIRWNGSKKTRMLEESINYIIQMAYFSPGNFELTGEIKAQGEDVKDRYSIKMVDNRAVRIDFTHTCPSCGHEFKEE